MRIRLGVSDNQKLEETILELDYAAGIIDGFAN